VTPEHRGIWECLSAGFDRGTSLGSWRSFLAGQWSMARDLCRMVVRGVLFASGDLLRPATAGWPALPGDSFRFSHHPRFVHLCPAGVAELEKPGRQRLRFSLPTPLGIG